MIKFHNVSKVYENKGQKTEALKEINVTVDKGDIFGVIGFSGAGKSTLLRTVNLLENPSTGEVLVDGKHLASLSKHQLRQEQKKIGMIFQHFHLLHSKTVYENVALPLGLSRVSKKEVDKRVRETLDFVGLSDKLQSYPDQLSGGQKQRVGIARALVTNPSILLCDEATSALDPQTTISILNLLKQINEEYKITILIITHEMEVIKEICNRVAVMENGRIIETETVFNLFTDPQTETTQNFVRSIVRDHVPDTVYHLMEKNGYIGRIFTFKFTGSSSGKPIISQISKQFDVEVNVLYGNITELQGTPFGNLIVELVGPHEEVEWGLDFARKQQVHVKEVTSNGNRNRHYFERTLGNVVHG